MIQGFHAYFMIFEHYFQWLLLGTIFMAVFPAVPITGMCLQYYYYPSAAVFSLVFVTIRLKMLSSWIFRSIIIDWYPCRLEFNARPHREISSPWDLRPNASESMFGN